MIDGAIIDVHFACFNCGMTYAAIQERKRVEKSKRFKCSDCQAEILGWGGDYDYHSWTKIVISPVGREKLS